MRDLIAHFDSASSSKESSLGSAYAAMGRNELGELHLQRALDLDPLNFSAAELLISLYENEGETAKAEALKRKIETLVY